MNRKDHLALCLERADELRRKYRAALLKVGKSPDYHIYDLTIDFLTSLKESREKRFLLKVKRFYMGLGERDRGLFVREVLEKDRHYAFWFLGEHFKRGEFERLKHSLLTRVNYSLCIR